MKSRSKRRSKPTLSSSREKARAHHKRLRARGLRPIQVWVPDTRTAAFKVEAHRQSQVVAQARMRNGTRILSMRFHCNRVTD